MATSFGHSSHRTPPPPPYEIESSSQFCTNERSDYSCRPGASSEYEEDCARHQTIPKTAHTQYRNNNNMFPCERRAARDSLDANFGKEKKPSGLLYPDAISNPRSFRRPSMTAVRPNNDGHERFVNSLTARKSFFGNISVEPLAFLAIFALYIEFPSIQDLIYTKICLEVVANQPNFDSNILFNTPTRLSPIQAYQGDLNATIEMLNATSIQHSKRNSSLLPANGRIQDSNSSTTQQLSFLNDGGSHANFDITDDPRRLHLFCDRLNKTAVSKEIRQKIIEEDSLFWLKYQIVICLLGALASPYWGGLSDQIGRLFPMNAPIFASILCNLISLAFGILISLNSHNLFHINWLYLGAVIVGLSGGQPVLIMNLFSFISDNTTSEERSKRVTVVESVIFTAHSLGFFLSKMIMLLGLDSIEKPWLNRHIVAFSLCVLLNLFAILYSVARLRHHTFHRFLNNFEREQQEASIFRPDQFGFSANSVGTNNGTCDELTMSGHHLSAGERLRELTSSTPDDPDGPIARSDRAQWTFRDSMITIRYYKETYQIATKQRDTRSIILLLLLTGFVSALSLATLMSLFYIYVKMDPFNWTTSQYSMWNSISAIARGVALITLTMLLKFASRWSLPDPFIAAIGFLTKGAGLLMIGLAQSSSLVNWSLVAFTFSEFSMPPIRSLLSKLVVREELCKIYSCLGALQSLCFILGNIAFYIAFTTYKQQNLYRLSFIVVAGIELGAVILVLIVYNVIRRKIPQILT